MDISQITESLTKDEEGYPVPIDQKNGDPYLAADGKTPSTITVSGVDAKAYVATQDRIQRRMLRSRKSKLDADDIRRNRIEQAAAGVLGWHGWEANGEPLPVTPENVKALLSINHILEQVEAGIQGHADFFAKRSVT